MSKEARTAFIAIILMWILGSTAYVLYAKYVKDTTKPLPQCESYTKFMHMGQDSFLVQQNEDCTILMFRFSNGRVDTDNPITPSIN